MNRVRGPLAFQPNTSTRGCEYPWTFHQGQGLGPSRILAVRGPRSGLQFALSKSGQEVHNLAKADSSGMILCRTLPRGA